MRCDFWMAEQGSPTGGIFGSLSDTSPTFSLYLPPCIPSRLQEHEHEPFVLRPSEPRKELAYLSDPSRTVFVGHLPSVDFKFNFILLTVCPVQEGRLVTI